MFDEHTDLVPIDKIKIPLYIKFDNKLDVKIDFSFKEKQESEISIVKQVDLSEYGRSRINVNRHGKGTKRLF